MSSQLNFSPSSTTSFSLCLPSSHEWNDFFYEILFHFPFFFRGFEKKNKTRNAIKLNEFQSLSPPFLLLLTSHKNSRAHVRTSLRTTKSTNECFLSQPFPSYSSFKSPRGLNEKVLREWAKQVVKCLREIQHSQKKSSSHITTTTLKVFFTESFLGNIASS